MYDSGFVNDMVTGAEEEVLRTSMVPNVIGGTRHWAFTTQGLSIEVRWRRRFTSGVVSTHSDLVNNDSARYFDWYVGSAANRLYYATAYLRQIAYYDNQ